MKYKLLIVAILLSAAHLSISPALLFAQKTQKFKNDSGLPTQLTKVVKKQGWIVPSVEAAQLNKEGDVKILNQSVRVKAYKPQGTTKIQINYYAFLEPNTLVADM